MRVIQKGLVLYIEQNILVEPNKLWCVGPLGSD